MGMKMDFKWNGSPEAIAGRILSDDAKLFAAATWHKLYYPFVPMDTGNLMSNVTYGAEGNMGTIEHAGPYAAYQYYGSGHNFSRSKHAMASAFWDQAARAAGKGEALAQAIQGYIGR